MTLNGVAHAEPGGEPGLIGEVVEASTTDFLAQALELDWAPPFGAFVEVASDDALTIYGVVAHVQTAGIEPGSRAIMRGHGDVRDERIYQENPDLPLVLRTTFRALVVGFADGGAMQQFLPPRPPRLHYSVFTCPPQRVRQFTDHGLDYLQVLLGAAEVPADELLAANLRCAARAYPDGADFLQQAGRELAHLLRADYSRLTSILRRCLAPSDDAPPPSHPRGRDVQGAHPSERSEATTSGAEGSTRGDFQRAQPYGKTSERPPFAPARSDSDRA